jgi:hypothetical protein
MTLFRHIYVSLTYAIADAMRLFAYACMFMLIVQVSL